MASITFIASIVVKFELSTILFALESILAFDLDPFPSCLGLLLTFPFVVAFALLVLIIMLTYLGLPYPCHHCLQE